MKEIPWLRSTNFWIVSIILLAAIVRFGYFFCVFDPTSLPANDSLEYDAIAKNLIDGNGYTLYNQPTASRAPGLTFMVAGIYLLFGKNFIYARIFVVLLSIVLVWVIYILGSTILNKKVGIWSALIAALWIHFILYGSRIFTEIPFTLFSILAILYVFKYTQTGKKSYTIFLAALFFALAILTRPVGLFLLFIVIVYLVLRDKRWKNIKQVILMGILTILLMSPWLIRNYIVFHRVLPVTSAGSLVLWISNNHYVAYQPQRWGYYVGFEQLPGAKPLIPPDEIVRTDVSLKYTWEFLKKYPSDIPRLVWNKTRRFWSQQVDTYSPRRWIIENSYLILIILSLMGLIYTVWSKVTGTIWLWIIILGNFVPALIYWSGDRTRLPAEPALMIFAAIFVEQVWEKIWRKRV